MKLNIVVLLVFWYRLCNVVGHMYSVVQCVGEWPVDLTDHHLATKNFQNWLYAWQNQCFATPKRRSEFYINPAPTNGMGSSLSLAVKNFMTAVEMNNIYRPEEQYTQPGVPSVWMWADHNKGNCTHHQRTFDCYTEPIACCGRSGTLNATSALANIKLIDEYVSHMDNVTYKDTCALARATRKPLQWVLGQFLHYVFRGYKTDIQVAVNERLRLVFGDAHTATTKHHFDHNKLPDKAAKPKTVVTIGMQLRAGSPDQGRVAANISHFVAVVDDMVARIAAEGKTVSFVYMCSHIQEANVVSSEHMTAAYPGRPFKWVVIPHTSTGEKETERVLQDPNAVKPPNSVLVTEFYSDIEILSTVDYFVGSWSNIYTVVTGLRIVRGVHTERNQSCVLDNVYEDRPVLHCEGDEWIKRVLWRGYWQGFSNKNASMDFVNG